jgi:undecaprenyl diphosphate synthase
MKENVPMCIGIILDGNRRWAKERGLPTLEGHRKGKDTVQTVARLVQEKGVPHLVVYAFSTENWKRATEEVSYLMDLFRELVREELHNLGQEGARIRFVGQRERFSPDLQDAMRAVEKDTAQHDSFTLWVCLSYGGRAEIVESARQLVSAGEEVTEESIAKHLWTAGMPDPDIIVRTGGEKRLSGFLTWQSIYSELFFIDTFWPDFGEKELNTILDEYQARKRNFGK